MEGMNFCYVLLCTSCGIMYEKYIRNSIREISKIKKRKNFGKIKEYTRNLTNSK